jgi:hypothetical protein
MEEDGFCLLHSEPQEAAGLASTRGEDRIPADFESSPFVFQTAQSLCFTSTCRYACVLAYTVLLGLVRGQWSEFRQRGREWKLAFTPGGLSKNVLRRRSHKQLIFNAGNRDSSFSERLGFGKRVSTFPTATRSYSRIYPSPLEFPCLPSDGGSPLPVLIRYCKFRLRDIKGALLRRPWRWTTSREDAPGI